MPPILGMRETNPRFLHAVVRGCPDLIFVMEDYMARELETRYGQDPAKIVCLDSPDLYMRDDPLLVHVLREALAHFVPQKQPAQ